MTTSKRDALFNDFFYPPFSTLDARSGWWRDRKAKWLAEGLRSDLGRAPTWKSMGSAWRTKQKQSGQPVIGEALPPWAETSIFDPVLCEIMYRWFVPAGGMIFDPFAGGVVRGAVASRLGLNYLGFDIRPEQISANELQFRDLHRNGDPVPKWQVRDACSKSIYRYLRKRPDFLFTCPPYGDLEVYSERPDDISTMPWDTFVGALRHSIKQTTSRLSDNRFAAFVVSDIRDKNGVYRALPDEVRLSFKEAGLQYYGELVLLNALGTLPIRVRGMFNASRKIGRGHQNVLLFVKGDPVQARQEIGDVRCSDPFSIHMTE
jgi:hypothetical protein